MRAFEERRVVHGAFEGKRQAGIGVAFGDLLWVEPVFVLAYP